MSSNKISVITVVYNGASTIEKTIQSVLNQTYKNIEYIIIDGSSKDNTLALIKKYENKISFWMSEPDKGLYDAMNKGLRKATGDYVCFLNSGDTFYTIDTLQSVFNNLTNSPDVIYGETMIVDAHGKEIGLRRLKAPKELSWKSFQNGMLVCHQSIYVKTSITEPYNLKYRISADFEWVLKALKKASNIHNSNQILTSFLDGGINKKNIRKGLFERLEIMIKHYGLLRVTYNHIIIGFKFFGFWIKNKRF